MSKNPETFAEVGYADIVNFLVFETSAYTLQDFKAYKSLQVFNQFACGWVKEDFCSSVCGKKVFLGKVMHSQRLSEKPSEPWLIVSEEGVIEAAHCKCMAGLGETCTHVAAVLFAIEFAVRTLETTTVTDVAAYWPVPGVKKVDPSHIRNIDLSTPQGKYARLSGCEDVQAASSSNKVPTPTKNDLDSLLYEPLSKTGLHSASFRLLPQYATIEYRPNKLPCFSELFDPENALETLQELQSMALSVNLSVTKEEAKQIEEKTKAQSKSKEWFRQRAGRITASRFKAVCHTKLEKPSVSLIKSICYPELMRFVSAATEWGCRHEKVARNEYFKIQKLKHQELQVVSCGLFVNPSYPHLGASPDGIVNCKCCGEGCLEIKCPVCVDVENIDKKSCIIQNEGKYKLDKHHSYYYHQVQAQLFICDIKYCDFVMWSEKKVYIERILPCEDFWNEKEAIATEFFARVILPEILGKGFTRQQTLQILNSDS